MESLRGLRQVTSGWVDLPGQHLAADVELYESTDRVAVALRALELEGDVIFAREVVLEVVRLVVEIVDDDVQPAVAVEVGDRGCPRAAGSQLIADLLLQEFASRRR